MFNHLLSGLRFGRIFAVIQTDSRKLYSRIVNLSHK